MSHRDPHSYDEHDHYHDEPDHSDSNSTATDELEEEEDDECPLCMEAFDATDREFTPCKCGYKICLWCWHNLNNIYTNTASSTSTSSLLSSSAADRPPLAGRCPACRQPYQYPDMTFNAAALQSSLTAKQQKKAHRDKHKREKSNSHHASSASTTSTSASATAASSAPDAHSKSTSDNNTRVLQRNLMYVANLPASVAKEELLEDKRYFGKFGKIVKLAITRKTGGTGSGSSAAATVSYSAYVTFKRAADCAVALQLCHHTMLQGQVVKCMYGTTKYCPFWLRSVPCTMNRCGYLHALASPEDVVGKEELQAMERKGENEKPIPFPLQTTVTEALAAAKAYRSVQPADEADPSSSSVSSSASNSSGIAPPASVWRLPVASAIAASSSASSATSSTPSLSSTAAAASSASMSTGSLRPYVSILAQSQTAIQSAALAAAVSLPPPAVTNEIIRIVPAYLKDKFTPTATPSTASYQPSTAAPAASATAVSSGRRKAGSTTSTATASPALSPVSTASASSITASPSMSRSTSKASSASSRASSPIPSPLLQPTDAAAASLSHSPPPAPYSARSVVSPIPPAALSPAASVTSIASSAFSEQQQPPPTLPSADEYQFDFLLYSQFDFSSFFSSYAAEDPLFSWLCTPSHAAVHPFVRARLSQQPQRSESRFEFARAGGEDQEVHREVDGKEDGSSSGGGGGGVDAVMNKQADSAWNEQKVDPAAGQGAAVIQQVSGRRTR